MSKLIDYPAATRFDSGDILIKDGMNGTKKITANTFLPSRTASVKLKKGETLYIGMGNIERTKLCLDLTIK